ncbi:MAG: glycosyltransferase family 2 protein [Anaerolineales bacterium]
MNELPLVSIITPSYNQARYLEATIQSVLEQEYPYLEYGVVDGGSTDASLEIIKRYADRLDWWVSEPDRGQGDAINKGMNRAKGDIVAWLNSDDIYLPDAIHKAVEVFQNCDPGMVFGDAITIDPHGVPLNYLRFGDWDLSDLLRFRVICQPAVFMKRQVWEDVGGVDTRYHCMLDHHLWIRVAAQQNIHHIPDALAASRYHPQAKNVAIAVEFSREIYRVIEWMRTHPTLKDTFQKDERRILGGAYRLSARYLLDGDMPGQAFMDYMRAVWKWPTYALKHWHRMMFAVFSFFTGMGAENLRRKQKPLHIVHSEEWRQWPGLSLSQAKHKKSD